MGEGEWSERLTSPQTPCWPTAALGQHLQPHVATGRLPDHRIPGYSGMCWLPWPQETSMALFFIWSTMNLGPWLPPSANRGLRWLIWYHLTSSQPTLAWGGSGNPRQHQWTKVPDPFWCWLASMAADSQQNPMNPGSSGSGQLLWPQNLLSPHELSL